MTAQGRSTPHGGGCRSLHGIDVGPSCDGVSCCLRAKDEVGCKLQDSPRCLASPSIVLYPSALAQVPCSRQRVGGLCATPGVRTGRMLHKCHLAPVQPPRPRKGGERCLLGAGSWSDSSHHPWPQDLGQCPAATLLSSLWLSGAGSLAGGCPLPLFRVGRAAHHMGPQLEGVYFCGVTAWKMVTPHRHIPCPQ